MSRTLDYLEYFRKTSLISETKNYKNEKGLFWLDYESDNYEEIYSKGDYNNILTGIKKDIFSSKNRRKINKKFKKEIKNKEPIKVLVSPIPIVFNNSLCHPILIPIKIFNVGVENKEIYFKPYGIPIISRDMMSIFSSEEEDRIFDYEKLNLYLKRKEAIDIFSDGFDGDSWNILVNYYIKDINNFIQERDLIKLDKIYFFEEYIDFNFNKNYEKVINVLRENKEDLNLFDLLTKDEDFNYKSGHKIKDLIKNLENEKKTSFLGQVKINKFDNNYFSLNINQRVFLNVMENEKVVALNGPPGTGKTTALQSVIATKIVSSFLKKQDMPIFFGAAATNQAKNNIIEGFQHEEIHSSDENNMLYTRWISLNKKHLNYGIPLNGKGVVLSDYDSFINLKTLNEIKNKYIDNSFKLNLSDFFNSELNYILDLFDIEIDDFGDNYLRCFEKEGIFNQFECIIEDIKDTMDIGKIKDKLNFIGKMLEEFLEEIENQKRKIIKDIRDGKDNDNFKLIIENFIKKEGNNYPKNMQIISEEYSSSFNFVASMDADLIYRELSYIIDNCFKPTLFNLAMRYYEAVFIEDLDSILKKKKVVNEKGFKDNHSDKKYKLFSNISPVFVSTMNGLPSAMRKPKFKNINKNKTAKPVWDKKEGYLFNFIDYLIVDEAGQCNSEKGAINLTFSKNAIIVGDTDQIEPIFSINDIEDYNAINHSLKNEVEYEVFVLQPYNSHNGNLMKMAQNSSNYSPYFNEEDCLSKGLYLLEHRRCPREIIEYCNDVVYGGKLIYPGGDEFSNLRKKSLLYLENQKPWDFINVEGTTEKLGSSNVNRAEAKKILEWIDDNYEELISKGKKLKDIIAILTCFSAQESVIRTEMYKINFKNMKIEDLQGITIGTAHKLQGAERPIVLFSFVYDSNSIGKLNFIDRNKNIINVAVSRAKQSFYIFGNKEVLSKAPIETPTGFLWKFIEKYS